MADDLPEVVSLDDPVLRDPQSPGRTQPSSSSAPPTQLTDTAYDPAKDREGVRSTIALSLIALLSVVVVVPFVLILFGVGCDALDPGSDICRRIPLVTLKDVLDTVLTPMVGLVGAVTGF